MTLVIMTTKVVTTNLKWEVIFRRSLSSENMLFLLFSLTIGDVLAEVVAMKREFVSDGLDAAIETRL
jgi:hypothetical protein